MATRAKRRRVAGPVGGDADPDPVAGFLSWCRRVGLELSPKVRRRGCGPTRLGRSPPLTHRSPCSGGGEPAGHGGRLRHGGPGERTARGAAVCRAAGRAPVAAHLLHRRPAGARARRAAEPVGLGAAAAGAAARAAGPGLALEPLLCDVAGARPLGAPDVLVRALVGAGSTGPVASRLAPPWPGDRATSASPGRVCEGSLAGVPPRRPEEERRRLLQGTGVPEAVEKDLANIRSEYYSIVLPFMEAHPDLFSPRVRSLELYHQLVALVMAYSFQEPLEEEEDEKEPNSPLMVPAADILNHLANHNANLEYSPNCLRMVATQPIPKGHEIFNTYGQMANWQLIHMYGFVEPYPDNTDDTADIQMVTVREAALLGTKVEAERLLLYERWDFLCKLEMVGEEGAFVIGREEVLTEEELTTTLKVLCMPAEEFREFKDQDGWGDDKREEESLTVTNIPRLKASWRQLLRDSVLLTLQTYATDLKSEQDLLSNKEVYTKLSSREQQALQVRYGQKMILHQLLELTS
ncbi:N-lysine methyltransferase SETD6 isoform X1 [Leopardus geoffroyi]|uniref:N-lysine methyltransferase SETD6 isoform X1 n=1 Tax=Leopardus geoffroyi TaxID=46844 RepID=UPI001E2615D4|nr:N-lysine methyltransferase SETD6 isoform X1 [Leopardus geoffroyi]